MIRVLLADDQTVVRSGLRMILESHDDLEVAGEAGDGEHALRLVAELNPDVVLMDIQMPILDGIEATRRVTARADGPRVLVLTTYGVDENVFAALEAGASGFLVKTDSPEHLVQAVRAVAEGDLILGRDVIEKLVQRMLAGPRPNLRQPPELDLLTDRERGVLKLLARGLSNHEIAQALFLSEATVKTHVSRVLSKLGCRDRLQAVVLAYEAGVVRPGGAEHQA